MNNGSGKEVDKPMRSYGDPIPSSRWSAKVQWHTVAPDYRSQLRKKRLQQYGPASGGGESKHNRFRLQHKVNFIRSGPWTASHVDVFSRLCRREPGTEDADLVEYRPFSAISARTIAGMELRLRYAVKSLSIFSIMLLGLIFGTRQ